MRNGLLSVMCGGCLSLVAASGAFAAEQLLSDQQLDQVTAGADSTLADWLSLDDGAVLSRVLAVLFDSEMPDVDLALVWTAEAGLNLQAMLQEPGVVAEQHGTETPLLDLVLGLLPGSVPDLQAFLAEGGGATASMPIVLRSATASIDSQTSTTFVPGVVGTAQASNQATTNQAGTVSVPGVSSSVFLIN